MTKGRGRMVYDLGSRSIHVVSALSIERVLILRGEEKPIELIVEMSNSSGIFQIQKILGEKIIGGPLEDYISLKANLVPGDTDYDKRIVRAITLKGHKFVGN